MKSAPGSAARRRFLPRNLDWFDIKQVCFMSRPDPMWLTANIGELRALVEVQSQRALRMRDDMTPKKD